MSLCYSLATISAKALQAKGVAKCFEEKFTYSLGCVDFYKWRLIRGGDFWFEDDGEPVFAPEDMVELVAYRGRRDG